MSSSLQSESSVAGLFKRLRRRLSNEFQLAVLLSFGLLATLTIGGMTIYRLSTGNLLGGLVNSAIAAAIVGVMVYAVLSRRVRLASLIFVLIAVAGCIASTTLLGRTGLLWSFVVLWINFLLVPRQVALTLNMVLIAALASQARLFDTAPEQITFCVTTLLVTGYGYVFSQRFNRQRKMLEKLATRDPLTGAGNRRLLRTELERAIDRFAREELATTLVVMDLDRFKQVNDRFGHEAGDRILERFCDHVRDHLRNEDSLFRMGGEEFVLLLPGMDERDAGRALTDLHQRLSGTMDGPDGPVAFSAGAATIQVGEDWSQWLARADGAMYDAKEAGRSRIHFA